jgi:hypothetical protein
MDEVQEHSDSECYTPSSDLYSSRTVMSVQISRTDIII